MIEFAKLDSATLRGVDRRCFKTWPGLFFKGLYV